MMSSIIRPMPETNSATKRQRDARASAARRRAGRGSAARGRGSSRARTFARCRTAVPIRAVTNEPPSVPIDATPSTRPSVAGRDVQLTRRVEHEQREEDEVEEVQRRDAEQLGADDRVVADPACARPSARPISRRSARRLVDAACARGRAPTRGTRARRRASAYGPAQQLHEHAAELLPARNENARLPCTSEFACT